MNLYSKPADIRAPLSCMGISTNNVTIDLKAFREIYDAHFNSLCNFLLFYSKNTQVIEDIIQEVFLMLWENRERTQIEHIKTYLFQAARNKMLNHLRDINHHQDILDKWFAEQEADANAEHETFDTEQLIGEVHAALESLPQKCKEIFILSKIENMTYREISDFKNISIKTVENQMIIALKKLRMQLKARWE